MMTGTQTTTGKETTAMAQTSDVTLPQSRRSWTGRAEPRPAGGRRASCRVGRPRGGDHVRPVVELRPTASEVADCTAG